MSTDRLSPGETSSSASSSLHLSTLTSQVQACSILTCAIQHLFLAKGQIPDPVPVLQSRRARERLAKSADGSRMGSRPKGDSFAKRRRTRRIDEVSASLDWNDPLLTQSNVAAIRHSETEPESSLCDAASLWWNRRL
jgi:hypothetical protein